MYRNETTVSPDAANWAASFSSMIISAFSRTVHFIADQLREVRPLDKARTAQDVINYANSIRHTDPSFADDLIAAANRSEDGL